MVSIQDIKTPPHNLDAERGVLSGILIDNEVMHLCDDKSLEPKDFYQKEHQLIFEAVKTLWNGRRTIDPLTLADQLEKGDNFEAIGGGEYLMFINTFLLSTSSVPEYINIVKEKSILRQILMTCQGIIGDVFEQKETLDILESIEKRIFNLTQINTVDGIKHIRDIVNSRVEDYMAIVDNPKILDERKVMSEYFDMDDKLGGFKPGDLVIVAARPAMGKTAFALNIATNAAINQKKTVAIFSLEMGAEQLVDRLLSMIGRIPMHKITKGQLDAEDFQTLGETMEILNNTNIYIDDKGSTTLPVLKSKMRRLKIEKGSLDLIIIDYLQLISGAGSRFEGNRVQEVSELSRSLKELARELEIPIIALSQLSRNVEQRIDKKPQLSDLRESGSIEQDADSVIMLFREDYYDDDSDRKGLADILIRKNRHGPTGEVELSFKPEIQRFDMPQK